MALLLDDEEMFVPTTTSAHMTIPNPVMTQADASVDSDLIDKTKKRTSSCMTTSPSRAAASLSSTAAAAHHEEVSPVSAGAAVTLPLRGGNGIEKMEAFAFGKAKIAFLNDSGRVSRRRSADDAFGSQITCTPSIRKTSSQRVCDSSAGGTGTQPKVLSPARSPSSSTMAPGSASATSLDTLMLTPHEKISEVAPTSPEYQPGSISASPPVRPPVNSSPVSENTVDSRSSTVATQPVKTQMKLSDFFSKMACKR